MKGGHANWNNQVDIMRYSISPNLSPKYHAFVQDKIEKMLSNQEKTYQHESHHIRNRENNLTPHKVAENLREFLTFRLLDELSAFMVGELYNKELTIENILESLQTARKKIIDSYYDQPFISEAHWYVSQHTGNQNLYSRTIGTEKYHSIIRQYFTTNKGNIISLLQESGKMSEFTAITNDLITRLDPLLKIKK
jgi:predicted house-cleaning noncanonical NTP pyrophosphatase (MazG superfamily)